MNQSLMFLGRINNKHKALVGNGQRSSKQVACAEHYAELLSALGERRSC